MINFDSTSWSSINDTIQKINAFGEMQVGETDKKETIVFDIVKDEEGNDCLVTDVFQKNGYIRRNIYNPDTLTVQEIYTKDD